MAVSMAGRKVRVQVMDATAGSGPLDPAKTRLSFGDGGRSSGKSAASHVYARRGTYRLSVTASDALGNSSSTSRTVTVR